MAQIGEQVHDAGFRESFNRNLAAETFQRPAGGRVQRGQEKAG